jgi:DNA-binding NtrC family response regulator
MATQILGSSAIHDRLLVQVAAAARTDAEVLIQGPSGAGKELYAHRIHELSSRSRATFVPVNCGALPPELFESELFGHARGAFTGARTRTTGLVAEAEGGTLFLDEVDSLPPSCQVKLLRFIQQKEYRLVGEARLHRANVRIISATNSDLVAAVHSGQFRFDLLFRLRVLPLSVPSLKERHEDIPLLLSHFVQRYAAEYRQPAISFSPQALQRLRSYDWPGNVRELENCVRYLICTRGGCIIEAADLPLLDERAASEPLPLALTQGETFQATKRRMVATFERQYIEALLQAHDGNIAAAARASGKHRRAFFELMRRNGLTRSR